MIKLCVVFKGADYGFDRVIRNQGACRGEIGLVKNLMQITANYKHNESVALAA